MIAAWMFYALLVGLLVTLAALAAERVLTLLRKPVRWVWTSALAVTLLVPAVSHFVPRRPVVLVPMERALIVTRDVIAAPIVRIRREAAASWWPGRQIDRGLSIGWLVASAGLSQLVLYSMAVLHGRRREWKRQRVDGAET